MKSLHKGSTAIVPVRMPDHEKQSIIEACNENETLSSFVREACRQLVEKRKAEK
jgi:hypothetical protein